ncbi:MAG: hypothetical protein GYA33_05080 [Thermogutta sp.]|nr:hypothetical protein [Thermogutta sp.]
MAESLWEWTPYRVEIYLAAEGCPELSAADAVRLASDLQSRLEYRLGASWESRVSAISEEAGRRLLPDLPALPPDDLPTEWRRLKTADKIVVVSLGTADDGLCVAARQWDVRAERWGPLARTAVPHESAVPEAVLSAVLASHVPLAAVQILEDGGVRLHQRGVALAAPQDRAEREERTPVYHVLARYEDRDGNARAVLTLPWTLLLPQARDDGAGIPCEVISGVRNPLTARRRGRVELLAWGQRPPGGETVLKLTSRDERKKPLADYDVFAKTPAEETLRWLGRTDWDGRLSVTDREGTPLMLAIKHGSRLVAKLPLVPGIVSEAAVALPDDDPRLEAEAALRGIQDELVDLVIQRTVLLAKVRARVAEEKWDEAADLLDQVRRLKSREVFSSEIMQLQQRIYCPEPTARQQVDKMFNEVRRLVNQYLDPSEFEKLVQQVSSRRRSPSSG